MKKLITPIFTLIISLSFSQTSVVNITRVEGKGNAGNELELTEQSIQTLFSNTTSYIEQPEYKGDYAPILVEIDDPSALVYGDYTIKIIPNSISGGAAQIVGDDSSWKMYLNGVGDTVYSVSTLGASNTQIIPQWGLAVTVGHQPLNSIGSNNYFTEPILSEMIYENNASPWLSGVVDTEYQMPTNWLRAGLAEIQCDFNTYPNTCDDPCIYNDYAGVDDTQQYKAAIQDPWGPYRLVSSGDCIHEPVASSLGSSITMSGLKYLMSVDVVFTDDTSKWTRCPVLETQDNPALSWNGSTSKQSMKLKSSVDKMGNPSANPTGPSSTNSSDPNYISATGMGWFPGYAVDVNTGTRLNIAFGEDSYLTNDNGNDMLFNPTSNVYDSNNEVIFGGKHYVYIFRDAACLPNSIDIGSMPAYDAAQYYMDNYTSTAQLYKMWRSCSWVGMPMLDSGELWLSSNARLRLRVKTSMQYYSCNIPNLINNGFPTYGITIDANTGLTTNKMVSNIKIYPNPTSNLINIENIAGNLSYNLFDLSGRLIDAGVFNNNSSQIDMSAYKPGIYILNISGLKSFKIIKK
jgi:hypothetical protein